MRPPLLTDDSIRAAIRELAASGERITGVALRDQLAARYGVRGGVARVYRLMRESQRPARDGAVTRVPVRASDESRDAAIARADLAEHRELAHQDRWARETDALRTRLAAAEQEARELELARRRVTELGRALATGHARITELERALARKTP